MTEPTDSPDIVHVALASDARGAEGLAVAIYSMLICVSRPVHIWIIEDRIGSQIRDRLGRLVAEASLAKGVSASVDFIAFGSLPLAAPNWWRGRRWPLISCARFQLPDVLPHAAARCIYLDIDMLIGADVASLFDADLGGMPIGMVPNTGMSSEDRAYVRGLGMEPDRYCNAGMLLMDLRSWRAESAGRGLMAHGLSMRPDLWFFDQDMLNDYFKDRCALLDERWNLRDAAAPPDGNILHFAGSPKPWNTRQEDVTAMGLVAWHRARAACGFEAVRPGALANALDALSYAVARGHRLVRRALS